jgi:hypothetical protein
MAQIEIAKDLKNRFDDLKKKHDQQSFKFELL